MTHPLTRLTATLVLVAAVAVTAGCGSRGSAPGAAPATTTSPAPTATTDAGAPVTATPPAAPESAAPESTAPESTAPEAAGQAVPGQDAPGSTGTATTVPGAAPVGPPAVGGVPLGATGDLEVAVRLRSDALLAGDVTTAERLLSGRCRALVAPEVLRAAAEGGFAAVSTVTVRAAGGTAEVDYDRAVPGRDVTGERWVAEDGRWRWDAC
ncbi:hypothetical protein MO973_09905 [Paenibacillus sp. TRM 82003]|uniref:hypothetical protein n=1 Tax=Kineococcus sp. TRM81007 TaxID=2925831 RepID=UPI001F5A9051|nr:hypothetical protein [Kineococcus sp. TRM81007]MCI2238162.1 hypothetical protein [Kineococcus sp. TRM81007]MCI3920546.1 hypothetical protein [Paenibacillus sp. TRM 82003]